MKTPRAISSKARPSSSKTAQNRKTKKDPHQIVAKLYRTQGRPMGLRTGLSNDNIGELLAQIEGDAYK